MNPAKPRGPYRWIAGGVTAPRGFKASGLHAGIKRSKTKDLALLYSEKEARTCGVFTSSQMKASCVTFDQNQLRNGRAQAITINSGNANCLTGKRGMNDTRQIARKTAKELKIPFGNVLVASTGIIGVPLPIRKILNSIPTAVKSLSREGHTAASQAILTTDNMAKEVAVALGRGKHEIRMGAMAKGAGMIHPQMMLGPNHATMLCYVTTDARISLGLLRSALQGAANRTFNCITIDADQSTNDMVVIFANGLSGKVICPNTALYDKFKRALEDICLYLAKGMILDAEGATKFAEVRVHGAKTSEDARSVANAVATSKLVKTALFGSDPNWGRIAACIGYAKAKVKPHRVKIRLGDQTVVRNGARVAMKSSSKLNRIFRKKNILITIDLGVGKESSTMWTCDLSTRYVRINSAYST